MQFRSRSFGQGEMIPSRHTCEGRDLPPELEWTGAPDATRSFVLFVEDPDAPSGTFTHWVRYDIPSGVRALDEDQFQIGLTGTNDFQTTDWKGPCPPPNHGDHRYFFRLFALDVSSLDLPPGARIDQVRERMSGHIVGSAELMGRYRRSTK